MEIVLCESIKQSPYNRVDNKRPASVAAILHWTLPFCIAVYSADLLGSVVEHGHVVELVDDGG